MPARINRNRFRPMLAIAPESQEQYEELKSYSWMASPKLDGIRCLIINGKPYSRSLKPIRNKALNAALCNIFKHKKGFIYDGELIHRLNWNLTSSIVMSYSHPQWEEIKFAVFDYIPESKFDTTTFDRQSWLQMTLPQVGMLSIVDSTRIYGSDLDNVIGCHQDQGFEGTMLRSLLAPYKCGRSTWNEKYLVKIKPRDDSVGRVMGFYELMHNDNPEGVDARGYTERSSCKDNLTPGNTLGGLILHDERFPDIEVRVGTGFSQEDRQRIWNNKSDYRHRLCNYSFQKYGMKDKPRGPVFEGWRDEEDM